MKLFFSRNIGKQGRWVRAIIAAGFLVAAILASSKSVVLALVLAASGVFVLFEAMRGWCVLRACGIKTKL